MSDQQPRRADIDLPPFQGFALRIKLSPRAPGLESGRRFAATSHVAIRSHVLKPTPTDFQNAYFKANCRILGSQTVVIFPNSWLFKTVVGLLGLTWLGTLK